LQATLIEGVPSPNLTAVPTLLETDGHTTHFVLPHTAPAALHDGVGRDAAGVREGVAVGVLAAAFILYI
jgi:hypothetical protein